MREAYYRSNQRLLASSEGTSSAAGDRMGTVVILLAILFSVVSFAYFYIENLTLTYGDAVTHLNIARRVFDNITPGLAQFGGIWLPLPHVLMIPFVWFDPLWRSGIGGSIVSMVAYIFSSLFIYGSVKEVTSDRWAGLVGALLFMASPSMMYMQTTPMTEPLLIGTSLMALYNLVRWGTSLHLSYLYLVSLGVFLATLSRYDGWVLIPAIALCIGIIGMKTSGPPLAEGSALSFMSLAIYGVFLWVFYNWTVFGDPLNFALGKGSASSYAQQFAEEVGITPKGDALLSLQIYGWTMIDVMGWLAVPVITLGAILYAKQRGLQARYVAGYAFLAPVAFNVFTLFAGQSVLSSTHMPPFLSYNVRYGLMGLPALAFFGGYLAAGRRWRKALIVSLFLIQACVFWPVRSMPILAEPIQAAAVMEDKMMGVTHALQTNYAGGKILISAGSNDRLIFNLNIPLKEILFEGNHPYWDISLDHPSTYATWVLMNTVGPGDDVFVAMQRSPDFATDFDRVYGNDAYQLYRNRKVPELIR